MKIEDILSMKPCKESVEFLNSCNTFEEAWTNCNRADWMLWLIGRLSGGYNSDARKKLKKLCDRLIEDAYISAATASNYADYEDASSAYAAANAEASISFAIIAANAALAAANAEDSAAFAGSAATYAASIAYAASAAIFAHTFSYSRANSDDVKSKKLKEYADLVREHYSINEIYQLFANRI